MTMIATTTNNTSLDTHVLKTFDTERKCMKRAVYRDHKNASFNRDFTTAGFTASYVCFPV